MFICRQITKEPSVNALPQQDEVKGAEQQPSAPRRSSPTAQQSLHGLSGQRQGSLHHTGLQSKAAQTVMQQRQAYLPPANPRNAVSMRPGT